LTALPAFESAEFESRWSRLGFRMKHPRFPALRTTGPVDTGKISRWKRLEFCHDASLHEAGALPNSLSPEAAKGESAITPDSSLQAKAHDHYRSLWNVIFGHDLNVIALAAFKNAATQLAKPRNNLGAGHGRLALLTYRGSGHGTV
jgi:hypothetical protein